MAAQIDPSFLVTWVRAELEASGDAAAFESLRARAEGDGLGEEEAELDVAGQLAERRGLLNALENAAGGLWLAAGREARGPAEKLERSSRAARVAWPRSA